MSHFNEDKVIESVEQLAIRLHKHPKPTELIPTIQRRSRRRLRLTASGSIKCQWVRLSGMLHWHFVNEPFDCEFNQSFENLISNDLRRLKIELN